MSLLDEWNTEIRRDRFGASQAPEEQRLEREPEPFALDLRCDLLARGRGHAVQFAASNDHLFVATSRNFLLRHDLSGATTTVGELELSRTPDARVQALFVDPLGLHALVVMQVGGSTETLYVDASWKKARPISKLRGHVPTAVAWPPALSPRTLSELLLGTEAGRLLELGCDAESGGKKDRLHALHDLRDEAGAVTGLLQAPLGPGRRLVAALCGTRLHLFSGGPSLAALFAGDCASRSVELPLDAPATALCTLCAPCPPDSTLVELVAAGAAVDMPRPEAFAVLSPSGVYWGDLDLNPGVGDDAERLVRCALLPAAALAPRSPHAQLGQQAQQRAERALGLVLTGHHHALLYPSCLRFVSRVSKALAQEVAVDRLSAPLRGVPVLPLALARDHLAGRVYLLAGDDALEVDCGAEGAGLWRAYLRKGQWAAALRHAEGARQRNAVLSAQADAAFDEGRYEEAGGLYGRVTSTSPSFEELALRLMDAGEPAALEAFLQARLDTLGPADAAQRTMVATWLLELLLDRSNAALLARRAEGGEQRYQELCGRLRALLEGRAALLDPGTTAALLGAAGRSAELLAYARARGDFEAVLEALLAAGEAEQAAAVLRRPSIPPELHYKFAPALAAAAPALAVQSWVESQPPLDPGRLLPALLLLCGETGEGEAAACAGPAPPPGSTEAALRYVRYAVGTLGSTDAALHNLAVALLAADPQGEGALLEYLSSSRSPGGVPLYDPVAALRVARERRCPKASVQLLCELGLYPDAVAAALSFDPDLAAGIARSRGDAGDEQLSRKLWLEIAADTIERGVRGGGGEQGGESDTASMEEDIRAVAALLDASGGALRIEDVLPLFPDFTTIDAFKAAVCSSLERYNQEIEDLRREMQLASDTAQAIREDLSRLDQREATVDLSEPCARCSRPLRTPPPSSAGPSGGALPRLYLFPTGAAYHASCLCAEAASLAPEPRRRRILALAERLAAVPEGAATAPARGGDPTAPVAELRRALAEVAAREDPRAGEESVTALLHKPFVGADEEAELRSWEL